MATISISKFLGEAPRLAAELLPDTCAQIAVNAKLFSGSLIPYPEPLNVESVTRAGDTKSLYVMRDPGTNARKWLHWNTDVDVATSLLANDTSQRIYYTGDGAPKQTDYDKATTGLGDYPIASRPLGLPVPTAAATATVGANTALGITQRARTGNIATVRLASAPLFGVGTVVTIAGVGGTGYNLTNVSVTAISGSDISYNSPGANEALVVAAAGTCAFAGTTRLTNYVYTWVTDWGEESQPSPASTNSSQYNGQQCTVSGLPTVEPVGYTGIVVAKRIYRAVTGGAQAYYGYVAEVSLATASYADTKVDASLGSAITTIDYDMPDASMKGMTNMTNGILVGFVGNQLCFSEPYKPWAWPLKYRKTVNGNIIAIAAMNTSVVVATDRSPSICVGTHPSVMALTRLDVNYPCSSKRSIVNMGYGTIYACPDGLAFVSSLGNDLITKFVHYRDTWAFQVDPTSIVARFYNGKYMASHTSGGFIFERDDKVGGLFVETNFRFNAAQYDFVDGYLYYIDALIPLQVKRWDDPASAPGQFDWKSKEFWLDTPTNFGAFRILADYTLTGSVAVVNAARQAANALISDALGGMGDVDIDVFALADGVLQDMLSEALTGAVTVQFYVDGELVYTQQIEDNKIYRLPAGYKSDVFAIRVSGTPRVREIQLAGTPSELMKI